MLTREKIERLNDLAKKKRLGVLSAQEAQEQQALRKEYLENFRGSMRETIENTTVIDPNGTDVTPEKIKQLRADKTVH